MRIFFDQTEINPDGVVSLSQSEKLFENTFKLGSVVCRTVTLVIRKDYVPTVSPETVFIKTNSGTNLFVMFLDSVSLENNKNYVFNLTDGMVKFNITYDWTKWSSLTTSTSNVVGLMASEILGNDYGVVYFPDSTVGGYTIPPYTEGASARQLISYVAEAMGGFARIRNSGGLEFVKLNDSGNISSISLDTCKDIEIGDGHAIDEVKSGEYTNSMSTIVRMSSSLPEGNYYQIMNQAGADKRYNITSMALDSFEEAGLFKSDKISPNPINSIDIIWNVNGTVNTKTITITYPDNNVLNKIYNFRLYVDSSISADLNRSNQIIDLSMFGFSDTTLDGTRAYMIDLPADGLEDNTGFLKAGVTGNGIYDRFFNKAESTQSEGIYIDEGKLYVLDPNGVFTSAQEFDHEAIGQETLYLIYEIFQVEDVLQNGTAISDISSYMTPLIYDDYGTLKVTVNINRSENIVEKYFIQLSATYNALTGNVYQIEGNPYFSDTTTVQARLNHLAENICGFEFYSFKTSRCNIAFRIPPDENLRAGTVITFYDNEQEVPMISQFGEMQYNTIWYGGYDCWLDNKLESDTSYYGSSSSGSSVNVSQGLNGTLTITE